MRAFLLLILFVPLLTSCNKEVVLTEETIPDNIFYVGNSNKPYTGKCLIYYSNSNKVHYTFTYKNGILNGPFKSYFENGKVEYEGIYFEGELSGVFKKYDEEGTEKLNCILKD